VAVRPLTSDDALAAIGRLDASFERRGIPYWLFGGWAVDFHAGRVTREHADIDIAIWQADVEAALEVVAADGWTQMASPDDDGYTSFVRGSVHLDLAFLAADANGIVYTPLRNGRGEWSPGSFASDVCDLARVRAHVVSLSSLIADKGTPRADAITATKDAADLAVLGSVGQQPFAGAGRPRRRKPKRVSG
jgi:Aminoglycoside-2''-adenylyltransferase